MPDLSAGVLRTGAEKRYPYQAAPAMIDDEDLPQEETAQSVHALSPFELQNDNPGELVAALWRDVVAVNDEFYLASRREVDFCLKHDHYEVRRQSSRDWRRTQPTTPDLFHTVRHKTSEICNEAIHVDCRGVDSDGMDDMAAGVAKSVIEYNIFDPMRRFEACIRRMVMGALAGRKWYTVIEWDPDVGPYGNIVFRNQVPWRYHVAPGYVDCHDPQCPWTMEELDMRIQDVWAKEQDGWKVEGLRADGARLSEDDPQGDASNSGSIGSSSGWPARRNSGHETVKILVWRARKDDGIPEEPSELPLKGEDQFMACPTCGYATADHARMSDGSMPPEGDACPQCEAQAQQTPPDEFGNSPPVNMLQGVTSVPEQEGSRRNIIGRMVVVAPLDNNRVLFDGPWDCPVRSFPVIEYKAYDHPFEPFGVSDTFLHWTQQVMLDMCLKSGFLQLMRNGDVIIAPYGALENADGTPFRFTGEHGNIAYTKSTAASQYVKHFQGSGISPGLPAFYGMVRDMMLATQGTSDLGLGREEIKQARVGVVQQQAESGEIPVREGKKMLRESLSIGCGVILDMTIHYWTAERWMRTFGTEGQMMMQLVSGDQIPNMDVLVTAEPQLDAIAMEQLDKLIQWSQLPLPTRRLTAKLMNLPATLMDKFEREMSEMQANAPLPTDGGQEYDAAGADPNAGPNPVGAPGA